MYSVFMTTTMSRRNKLLSIGLILLLALGLRVWHFIELRQSPYFGYPIIDSLQIQRQAESMAEGRYPYTRAFFKAPFYPHLMGLFYYLFGTRYSPFHLLQLILGAVNCVLLYLLASRFLPPWAAVAAGIIAALYRPFIFFEGELLTPALLIFFNLLLVIRLGHAWDSRSKLHIFLAGLLAGFSSITRSTGLLFAVLIIVFSVIYRFTTSRRRRRRQAIRRLSLLFILGMALIISPVTILNYHLEGDFVLVSSNAGINFFTGNNEKADGTTPILPGIKWERLSREQRGWGLPRSSAVSRAWGEKGLYFIQENPGKAAMLLARKFLLFFKHRELRNNKDIESVKRFSTVLRLPLPGFGLIVPLTVLGAAVSARKWRELWCLYLVPVAVLLVNVIFFTCARYRLTAVPFLICFALLGLVHLVKLVGERNRRELVKVSFLLLILFGYAFQPWWPAQKSYMYRDYFNLGNIYWQRKNIPQARESFLKAVDLAPHDPDSYTGLALVYEAEREIGKAQGAYFQGLKLAPDHPDLLINLGSLLVRLGQYERAGDFLLRALKLQPGNPLIHFNLAVCLESLGKFTGATKSYRKALELGGPLPDILNNLGYLYIKMGINQEEAVRMLKEAVRLQPGDGLIRDSLGWGYFKTGKIEEGRSELEKARELESGNLQVRLHLATVYAALKESDLALKELIAIRDGFPGTREAAEAAVLISAIEAGQKDRNPMPDAALDR